MNSMMPSAVRARASAATLSEMEGLRRLLRARDRGFVRGMLNSDAPIEVCSDLAFVFP